MQLQQEVLIHLDTLDTFEQAEYVKRFIKLKENP